MKLKDDVEFLKEQCYQAGMRWVKARPSFVGQVVEKVAEAEDRVQVRLGDKELWWPKSCVETEGKKMPTVEQVVEKLYGLRDRKTELNEELKKLKEAEEKLDAWLLWALKNAGLSKMGVETSHGNVTVFSKINTRYSVADWDSVRTFVEEEGAWDILTKSVSSSAVKELVEHGENVPGLNVYKEEVVQVRKS